MSDTVMSLRGYLVVAALLLLLLGATVGASMVSLGAFGVVVALLIAASKAGLVGAYFMHLRFSKPLTRLVAMAGLVWLLIALILTMTDYLTRAQPIIGMPK